jgi:hypothetical protein
LRLIIVVNLILFSLISKSSPVNTRLKNRDKKCEMGLLLSIRKKVVKVSFSPLTEKMICLRSYKYKNFSVNFGNLEDDILLKNATALNKIKKLIKSYANIKRVTIFDDSFQEEDNYFEFKNSLNRIFKSTTIKISKNYLRQAFEYDFRLSTEKLFNKKRTGIILKSGNDVEFKGLKNYAHLIKWSEVATINVSTNRKKYTDYSNKYIPNQNKEFGLNNSTQNIFITTENLFRDKFFLDKKTKIVKANLSNVDEIQVLNSKKLKFFLKGIPKSNIYFYRLNWEKYYYILNQ